MKAPLHVHNIVVSHISKYGAFELYFVFIYQND